MFSLWVELSNKIKDVYISSYLFDTFKLSSSCSFHYCGKKGIVSPENHWFSIDTIDYDDVFPNLIPFLEVCPPEQLIREWEVKSLDLTVDLSIHTIEFVECWKVLDKLRKGIQITQTDLSVLAPKVPGWHPVYRINNHSQIVEYLCEYKWMKLHPGKVKYQIIDKEYDLSGLLEGTDMLNSIVFKDGKWLVPFWLIKDTDFSEYDHPILSAPLDVKVFSHQLEEIYNKRMNWSLSSYHPNPLEIGGKIIDVAGVSVSHLYHSAKEILKMIISILILLGLIIFTCYIIRKIRGLRIKDKMKLLPN